MKSEKRKISAELYDAIMEQSKVSMKIAAILKKEEDENFWPNLEKDIDDSLRVIKMGIDIECSFKSSKLDKDMLKDRGFVYNMEMNILCVIFLKNRRFQPDFYSAVIRPLKHIMEARRKNLIDAETRMLWAGIDASMAKITKQ